MNDIQLAGTFGLTELIFILFIGFFIALVFYLQREGRREGFPMENEATGRVDSQGGPLLIASPKTFHLPHGQGTATPENEARQPVDVAGKRTFRSMGAPYYPTGNPLEDGLGPAAFAERSRTPDLTFDGKPRIVPIGDSHMHVVEKDPDPRGLMAIGADGKEAGPITDIWVDQAEHVIRYLEVDTGAKKVLVPMPMCVVRAKKGTIIIDALNADEFANAPVPEKAGIITRYEEERAMAYFGGGYLYANRARQEPFL